tara:strand:- start:377 stop:574 length:198 start_codon:yes stop_codon:yes gene_type:complete
MPPADYVVSPPLELIRAWPSTIPVSRTSDPSTKNDALRRQIDQLNSDFIKAATTQPKQRRRFRLF